MESPDISVDDPVVANLRRQYDAKCAEHDGLLSHISAFRSDLSPYFPPVARDQMVDTRDLTMQRSRSTSTVGQNVVDLPILASALWAQFETLRTKDAQAASAPVKDPARDTLREKIGDAEHRIKALEEKAEDASRSDDMQRLQVENAQLRRDLEKCRGELEEMKASSLRVRAQLQAAKNCACDAMSGENEVSQALLIVDQKSRRLKRELREMRRSAENVPVPASPAPAPTCTYMKRYSRLERMLPKPLLREII